MVSLGLLSLSLTHNFHRPSGELTHTLVNWRDAEKLFLRFFFCHQVADKMLHFRYIRLYNYFSCRTAGFFFNVMTRDTGGTRGLNVTCLIDDTCVFM